MKLGRPYGPLHEGLEGCFYPEVAYVTQGEKILFFKGNQALTECVGMQVVEKFEDLDLTDAIVEGQQIKRVVNGKWVVEGPFQRSDIKNANGRTYSRKLWEKQVGDVNSSAMQTMVAGGMIGHLEHPADGRTDGKEGAIFIRSLRLMEDGVVWGKSEILDTPNGIILQEYTRKGVRWGVSSRGNGSVKDDGYVNEDDYTVETWDAVMRPSTPGAYPTVTRSEDSNAGTRESLDSSNDPKINESSDRAEFFVAKVDYLVSTDVSSLEVGDIETLKKSMSEALSEVDSLIGSKTLPESKGNELKDWLTGKMKVIQDLKSDKSVVAESATDAVAKVEETIIAEKDAIRRTVNELQERLESTAGTSEESRVRAETAEAKVEALTTSLAEAELKSAQIELELESLKERSSIERGVFEEKLVDAQKALVAERERLSKLFSEERKLLQEQLSIAQSTLVDLSKKDALGEIKRAVVEVVEDVPELLPFESALETAISPEHVRKLAEKLLPAATSQPRQNDEFRKRSAVIIERTTLPKGVVESESGKMGGYKTTQNPSEGARLSAKALARKKKQ